MGILPMSIHGQDARATDFWILKIHHTSTFSVTAG